MARVSRLLHERAPVYFDEFRGMDVSATLVHGRQRRYSTIYRFELAAGDSRRRVFVKLRPADSARSPRPRATPAIAPGNALALYHDALRATHDHFQALADPRFSAVRPLDFVPEIDALVMEEAEGEQLWKLLRPASRLHPLASVDLDDVLSNAGGWLREFHRIRPRHAVTTIHDGQAGFVELLTALTDYLGESLGEKAFFDRVAAKTRILAEGTLVEPLPLGLHFGDYGLTNVLVAPNARVTGIDMLANWCTPIYVDIAYFLTGIKTYRKQIATQGLAFGRERLAAFERQFLVGYFGRTSVPTREIRLFEVLRLLERWSGRLARNSRRSAAGRKLGLFVVNRFLRRTLGDLVRELEAS
ncbi:MAG: aminoglycoside phosphotransferase family protein [Actinomycetota bacterium]|nr:aminoglycoside phosphotransferase family protein [Actinomycetota bacterium]